uniref:Unknow protein n=1 Tax=Oryza sativa subsp. japonica TaxID=39947 RepID=Q68Y50_ORYSJ|nr:unknow protein [Oryza sativa Japonica Group]
MPLYSSIVIMHCITAHKIHVFLASYIYMLDQTFGHDNQHQIRGATANLQHENSIMFATIYYIIKTALKEGTTFAGG